MDHRATLRHLKALLGVIGLLLAPVAVSNPFADVGARPGAPLVASDAFMPDPAIWRDGVLHIGIRVAPHHYLYQHAFELVQPAVTVVLDGGEAHHDEHFGDVVIYRHQLHVATPLKTAPEAVTVRYQGCADAGICYPPQTRTLNVMTVQP
jgi:thiol:disulfide interchange protein